MKQRRRIVLQRWRAGRWPCLPFDCWEAARHRRRDGPCPDVQLRRARRDLAPGDRRRTAMQAARDRDRATLWSLTEAWRRTFSAAGASVSAGTVRSYRGGVFALLDAWLAAAGT